MIGVIVGTWLALVVAAPGPQGADEARRADVPIAAASASASSAMPPWKGYTFDAANLLDGDVATSWQPAKSDTLGVGQWFEVDLGATYELSAIEVDSGLQKVDPKLGDLFCRNTRVRLATLLFDDGAHLMMSFAPMARTTRAAGPFLRGADEVQAVRTRRIRFVVNMVFAPVDWKDLAVAELRAYGVRVAELPTPAAGADVACGTPGYTPFTRAISTHCGALRAKARAAAACDELLRGFTTCESFIATDDVGPDGEPLGGFTAEGPAEVTAAELAAHRAELTFPGFGSQHRITFTRPNAETPWRVSAHERVTDDGTPPSPEARIDRLFPEDFAQNLCWEQLGKTPPRRK